MDLIIQSDQNNPGTHSIPGAKDNPPKSICFKVFVVVSVLLAVIAIITSALAILGYNGVISGLNSIGQLLKIGEVNSYLMLTAGTIMFAISLVAWVCHLKKENSGTGS